MHTLTEVASRRVTLVGGPHDGKACDVPRAAETFGAVTIPGPAELESHVYVGHAYPSTRPLTVDSTACDGGGWRTEVWATSERHAQIALAIKRARAARAEGRALKAREWNGIAAALMVSGAPALVEQAVAA